MSNKELLGKKILFLAPAFFNYEIEIKKKMEELGAVVYFFDERSVKRPFCRAFLGIAPGIFDAHSRKYYDAIIESVKDVEFDYIFVIKSEMIPEKTLKKFKEYFPNACMCLYLYDSIKHIPGVENKIPYYDFVSTFDRIDCIENSNLHFLPLFYTDAYRNTDTVKEYKYDLAFCGTIHTDRYAILKQIMKQAEDEGWRFYKFFYLQAKFAYYLFKITKKEFWDATPSVFDFEKKSGKELANEQSLSKAIIDIETPDQKGLTMRTIEMIGLKKKLITTNKDVMNYDFYNSQNICVLSRSNPVIPKDFFESEYQPISSEIYDKYYIGSWVLDVLNLKQ